MTARNNAPTEWLDKTCANCGKYFTTLYRFNRFCCPECAKEARHERHLLEYNPVRRNPTREGLKYEVVSDPDSEAGLFRGLGMNKDEVVSGLAMNSYTPGTVIKHKKTKKVYCVVAGEKHQKLVEVGNAQNSQN